MDVRELGGMVVVLLGVVVYIVFWKRGLRDGVAVLVMGVRGSVRKGVYA